MQFMKVKGQILSKTPESLRYAYIFNLLESKNDLYILFCYLETV